MSFILNQTGLPAAGTPAASGAWENPMRRVSHHGLSWVLAIPLALSLATPASPPVGGSVGNILPNRSVTGLIDRQVMGSPMALLTAVVAQPFAQRDWPVPKAAQPSIALRTHLDPLKLLLAGQDRFFGAPGQPPDTLIGRIHAAPRFARLIAAISTRPNSGY